MEVFDTCCLEEFKANIWDDSVHNEFSSSDSDDLSSMNFKSVDPLNKSLNDSSINELSLKLENYTKTLDLDWIGGEEILYENKRQNVMDIPLTAITTVPKTFTGGALRGSKSIFPNTNIAKFGSSSAHVVGRKSENFDERALAMPEVLTISRSQYPIMGNNKRLKSSIVPPSCKTNGLNKTLNTETNLYNTNASYNNNNTLTPPLNNISNTNDTANPNKTHILRNINDKLLFGTADNDAKKNATNNNGLPKFPSQLQFVHSAASTFKKQNAANNSCSRSPCSSSDRSSGSVSPSLLPPSLVDDYFANNSNHSVQRSMMSMINNSGKHLSALTFLNNNDPAADYEYGGVASTGMNEWRTLLSDREQHQVLLSRYISPQPKSNGPVSGPLFLTEEEKKTLLAEGYPIPKRYPLSKSEEKSLKKIRRKIKNKISAQESRRKKKEYIEALESKLQAYAADNNMLKNKVKSLETNNISLQAQLKKLTNLASSLYKSVSTQTNSGSCFVILFSFLMAAGFNFIPRFTNNQNEVSNNEASPASNADIMSEASYNQRVLHQWGKCENSFNKYTIPNHLELMEELQNSLDNDESVNDANINGEMTPNDETNKESSFSTKSKASSFVKSFSDFLARFAGKHDEGKTGLLTQISSVLQKHSADGIGIIDYEGGNTNVESNALVQTNSDISSLAEPHHEINVDELMNHSNCMNDFTHSNIFTANKIMGTANKANIANSNDVDYYIDPSLYEEAPSLPLNNYLGLVQNDMVENNGEIETFIEDREIKISNITETLLNSGISVANNIHCISSEDDIELIDEIVTSMIQNDTKASIIADQKIHLIDTFSNANYNNSALNDIVSINTAFDKI